jgi:hypothetical protein
MLLEIVDSSEQDEAIGHIEDLLPKIQELEPTWISVEERLPDKDWDIFIVTD